MYKIVIFHDWLHYCERWDGTVDCGRAGKYRFMIIVEQMRKKSHDTCIEVFAEVVVEWINNSVSR